MVFLPFLLLFKFEGQCLKGVVSPFVVQGRIQFYLIDFSPQKSVLVCNYYLIYLRYFSSTFVVIVFVLKICGTLSYFTQGRT